LASLQTPCLFTFPKHKLIKLEKEKDGLGVCSLFFEIIKKTGKKKRPGTVPKQTRLLSLLFAWVLGRAFSSPLFLFYLLVFFQLLTEGRFGILRLTVGRKKTK